MNPASRLPFLFVDSAEIAGDFLLGVLDEPVRLDDSAPSKAKVD
jgi:hypothetical protein